MVSSVKLSTESRSVMHCSIHLPTIVLSEVFFQLVLEHWSRYFGFSKTWRWFSVSHVCRQWRSIALDHPAFWSYITTSTMRMDGVKAFIARSGAAVLHFRHEYFSIDSQRKNHIAELEFALQHLHRTEDLIILGDFPKLHDIGNISTLLKAPTPYLKRLAIVSYLPFFRHFIIPNSFFVGADLEQLTLVGLTMDWNSFNYKNLKELTLAKTFEFQPTVHKVYQILQQSPKLERLMLEMSVSTKGINKEALGHPVDLPHLQTVDFAGLEHDVCVKLLEVIHSPYEAMWDIDCSDYPIEKPSRILSHIQYSLSHQHSMTLYLSPNLPKKFLNLFAYVHSAGFSCSDSKAPYRKTKLAFVTQWTKPSIGTHDFFCNMKSLINNSFCKEAKNIIVDLKTMGKTSFEECSVSWYELLSALPSLQGLEVILPNEAQLSSREWIKSLFKFLMVGPSSADEAVSYHCQSLAELRILNLDCDEYNRGEFLIDMKDCLDYRNEKTLSLQKVKIDDAKGIRPAEAEALLPNVLYPYVQWCEAAKEAPEY